MSLLDDSRSVAELLNDTINERNDLTQKELSEYSGFEKPNIIYMFKTGKTKIPLDKAGLIAEKLGLNKQEFWFKCFQEYQPEVYKEFERINSQPVLSLEEVQLILKIRESNIDPNELLKTLT
jgi:plasmid maintenance system antidote protein VapI